jgi:histidine triad (HIT) family protein
MGTVQKIARAAKKAFAAEGVLIKQYNEAAAGQTVFHLHFHVIPRKAGEELKPHTGKMADPEVLAKHAEAMRGALRSG